MRYLLDISGPPEPLRPFDEDIDEDVFQTCLKLLHMQMRRHNEEYEREHPREPAILRYIY